MRILQTILLIVFFTSCSRDVLSSTSVVESGMQVESRGIDHWIRDSITIPYGISVEYRWDRNNIIPGTYSSPPNPEKVKDILKTIKYLWLETYELPNFGKKDFMKGKNPIKIYIYGGQNKDSNGVELLGNSNKNSAEMYLYNADDFDSKNSEKVFILMRSVHHQFVRRLVEVIPYDRDEFLKISYGKYKFSTNELRTLAMNISSRKSFFSLHKYFNKMGFHTFHASIDPESDFAEIASTMLTHTPMEIENAKINAKTPDRDDDPQVQMMYNKEAEQAYEAFVKKQKFVEEYFNKNFKINTKRMQQISLERMKKYIDK